MDLYAPPSLMANLEERCHKPQKAKELVCPKWFLWWVCCSSMLCLLWDPCALSSQEEAHQEQLVLLGPLVPLGLLVRMACLLLVLMLVCPKWFLWSVCCSSMLCLLWDPCALSSQEEAHQCQAVLRSLLLTRYCLTWCRSLCCLTFGLSSVETNNKDWFKEHA